MEEKYSDRFAATIKEVAELQAQRKELEDAHIEYSLIRNQYLLKVRRLADKIFTEGVDGTYIPSWKEKVYVHSAEKKLFVSEASTWFGYIQDEHSFPTGYKEGKIFVCISLSGSPLSVDNKKINYFFDALGVKEWFIDVSNFSKKAFPCVGFLLTERLERIPSTILMTNQ